MHYLFLLLNLLVLSAGWCSHNGVVEKAWHEYWQDLEYEHSTATRSLCTRGMTHEVRSANVCMSRRGVQTLNSVGSFRFLQLSSVAESVLL